MPDYSTMSDAELQALYNQQTGQATPAPAPVSAQQPQSQDYSKMSDAQLQELFRQQQAAQQSVKEDPRNLPQPISSDDKKNVAAILSNIKPSSPDDGMTLSMPKMSQDFVRDFRSITGVHPETLRIDKDTSDERFATSAKEAFNAAVADGLIKPDFSQGELKEKFQNFETKWNEYKTEMESSMLGAAARGAKTSFLPTVAAVGGALLGSPSVVGSIGLGAAAGMGAAVAQEQLFPSTSEEKAQRAFDQSKTSTRNARLAGEILPQFATGTVRPTLNAKLFSLAPDALKQFIGTTVLTAGLPAAIDYVQGNKFDPERFAWGVANAAFVTPTRFGQKLFDKSARTEMLATEARNKIFADERFLGISGPNRADAIARLRNYGEASINGIQPMMGEYLENQAIISFQKALQNSKEGARMRQRQFDNQVAAAAANERLAGYETLVDDRAARTFFEQQHAELNAQAQHARQQLIAQGNADAEVIIAQAHAQSEALNLAREQGIITAENAVTSANSVFSQAVEDIHASRGTSTTASTRAVNLLDALKDAAYVPVRQAYAAIPKNAITDYQNTYRAAKKAASKTSLGSLKSVPAVISDILQQYAPRIGRGGRSILPRVRISVMMKDLETITEEISKAVLAKENSTARLLGQIKTGIERDLSVAEASYEGIRIAKDLYYQYAQKYVNGTVGNMLHASQSLDKDLRLSEMLYSKSSEHQTLNGPQQLLAALNGSGEDMVLQQLLNDMAQQGGGTSASLEKWINSDKISRVLATFPMRNQLEAVINRVRDAEVMAGRARAELDARRAVPIERPNRAELDRAQQVRQQARDTAEIQYRAERERLQNEAFTAFVGADCRTAIRDIMSSRDPVGVATQMMQAAAGDASGEAVVGLQNAMRQHYKEAVASTKALTSGLNMDDPLQLSQLQVISGKINAALVDNGPLRSVMNVVLPPSELQTLDVLRRQVQYITNPFRNVNGDSVTASMRGAMGAIEDALNNNAIGILGKIARGGNLNRYIQNGTTRFTDAMQWLYYGQPDTIRPNNKAVNAIKGFAEEWFGLTGKGMEQRAAELLVDAMLNPSTIGIEAIQGNPASPRMRAFIRAYVIQKDQLVEQPTVLPFNSLNTKEVQLENGKLLKDGVTGYSIQNTANKFKVFNQKGERIGIYNDLEEARQSAVVSYNKHIMNVKSGKQK